MDRTTYNSVRNECTDCVEAQSFVDDNDFQVLGYAYDHGKHNYAFYCTRSDCHCITNNLLHSFKFAASLRGL